MWHELWPICVAIFAKIPGFGDALWGPGRAYMPDYFFDGKKVPTLRIYGIQNLPCKKYHCKIQYLFICTYICFHSVRF